LAEEDAEEATLDEIVDEIFDLSEDDTSYVGLITEGG
jgi:hypothetical protein